MKVDKRMQDDFVRDPITWTTYGLVGYFAFTETVLGPVMPFLREEQGLGYAAAGLHFSAFALGGLLVGVLGERLLGRWGRWTGLWGGAAGIALGTLLLVLSPGAWTTIPATFVMGFCGALLLVASEALLSTRHGERSAVALSESNVAASACAISAPLLVGAFTAAGLGWRVALGAPVVALLLLAAFSFSRSRARPERSAAAGVVGESAATGVGSRTLPPRYWTYWALVSLGVASEWCVGYWGVDFLDDGAGLARSGAAAALTVFLVAMLAGRILGSRLARTVPTTTLLAATLGVALVGFPVFWLSGGTTLALTGLFITGLGIGSIYPLGVSAALAAAPGNADVAAARLSLGGGGAVFIAPFVLGALADRIGIGLAFGIVAPMLLAAIALVFVAGRAPGQSYRTDFGERRV